MRIQIHKTLAGSILDVGGGGEGVIGQVYQAQVTAIDNRQEELDEAPDGFQKLLMDAGRMTFADASFDHVTLFYTLMYMDKATQTDTISECARVLRRSGSLHIWDTDIQSAYPEPFLTELEIDANGRNISVTYGIVKENAKQDAARFLTLCEHAGLRLVTHRQSDAHFYLSFTNA